MIIIGANNYALIAARAALDCGDRVVLVIPQDDQVCPTGLVFDTDFSRPQNSLRPIRMDDVERLAIEPDELLGELMKNEDVVFISTNDCVTAIASIQIIQDLAEEKMQAVFTEPLPKICLDTTHEFKSVKVWETVVKTSAVVEEPLFLTNTDFSEYPWSHCLSIRNIVVKLYPEKPPIRGAKEYALPVSTTCTCHRSGAEFALIGPEAKWSAQEPRENVYPTIARMVAASSSLQERMF